MRFIRMLFPGIIMQTQEGANMLITLMLGYDFFKNKIGDDPYADENNTIKLVLKIVTVIGRLLVEFIKRLAFVSLTALLPWLVLSKLCPLIAGQKELTVIYCFFVLSTVCGTFVNSRVFSLSDRDVFLIGKASVDQSRYYFGKVVYRMVMDFIFDALVLMILGVSASHAFLLALITSLARPVGEVFGIVMFAVSKKMLNKKSTYDGVVIALAIIVAYTVPYVSRRIDVSLYGIMNVPVIIVMCVLAFLSLYVLWNYKRYGHISREMVLMRRED